jgi:hypothetical protein
MAIARMDAELPPEQQEMMVAAIAEFFAPPQRSARSRLVATKTGTV